jgi:quinol monooxygenase YgiN
MELSIFARFHVRAGREADAAATLREVADASRTEAGCLFIDGYGSIRDPRLFHIHSRWVDEAAFELHAGLPHTVRFLERMRTLADEPLEVSRARPLAE